MREWFTVRATMQRVTGKHLNAPDEYLAWINKCEAHVPFDPDTRRLRPRQGRGQGAGGLQTLIGAMRTVLKFVGGLALVALLLWGCSGVMAPESTSVPGSGGVLRGTQSMWHPISAHTRTVVLLKADSRNNLPSTDEIDQFFEAFATSAASDGQTQLTNVVVTYDLRGRRMSIRFDFVFDAQSYEISGQLVAPDVFSSRQQLGFVPTWISAETIQGVEPPYATVARILAALEALLHARAADAAQQAGLSENIPV